MGTDNSQRIKELWARFDGPVALAAADVFYQLTHSQWRLRDRCPVADLISTFAKEIRPILEQCITDRESLPTIFRYGGSCDRNVIRFLIEALGTIGDAATVLKLQLIADDPEFGRHAIQAIQSIQKNAMPQGTLGSLGHQKAQDRLDPMLGG